MAGCLKALRFWRQKKRTADSASTRDKFAPPSRPRSADLYNPEKPHHYTALATGVQAHADDNTRYLTYSTSGVSRKASHLSGATLHEEADGLFNEERQRQAEQEEQERLDFFQMM